MATDDWRPTLRQMIRGTMQIALDSLTLPFSRKKKIHYLSADQRISGTIYYPEADGPVPAVLLLPTAFGLTPHEHRMASRLAREGYATLVIAYSKRTTGAIVKDRERCQVLEQIIVNGLQTLRDDSMVDANRTAVIGLSLGGYFATYLATTSAASPPKAAVVYYGMYALPEAAVASLDAPLLILQGESDYSHFVNEAKRVQELAERYEKICDLVLYSGTGHQFDLFEPSSAATQDAWARTVKFLRRHIGSSSVTPGVR
jgi:dienelactone hydrolase